MKADRTVLKETGRTAAFTFLLTLVMHAVFLIGSWWDLTVLWGSLLGLAGAVADFFLLGLGVQKAVSSDEKTAKNIIRISQQGRLMMLAVILVIAFTVPVFHKLAAILPLFFQKIGVRLRALFDPEIRNPGSGNKGSSLPDIESIENGGDAP
ncbi:MAG: hypothetical protein IKI84_03980 [Clostridia bacterium]|nr:hypothetical protein [Clostridia bacterium]